MPRNSLLHRYFLTKTFERILPLQFLQLDRRVLIQELVNRQKATANTNIYPVVVNSDVDLLGAELIDAL